MAQRGLFRERPIEAPIFVNLPRATWEALEDRCRAVSTERDEGVTPADYVRELLASHLGLTADGHP